MSHTQTPHETGTVGGVIGDGPFAHELHSTPGVVWVGVLIVCVGSLVAGAGVTAMHWGTKADVWILVAIGAALTAAGIVVLLANHVMTNVH